MTYIILDMEWDGAYCPRISRFINQIIQIGAVKLNEDFEINLLKKINIRLWQNKGITTHVQFIYNNKVSH